MFHTELFIAYGRRYAGNPDLLVKMSNVAFRKWDIHDEVHTARFPVLTQMY